MDEQDKQDLGNGEGVFQPPILRQWRTGKSALLC